ncbi:MAG: hypothetical protein COA44_15170 [Arcobacter sp.]|nr:MAG: hypothetical protein COA44_15170 [Arcobacter sp.]
MLPIRYLKLQSSVTFFIGEPLSNEETVRYDKDYPTKYDGVYYRLARNKRHNGKPDKTFKIRYRLNGVSKNESIGKLSEGFSAEFARNIRNKRIMDARFGNDIPNAKGLLFKDAVKRYFEDHSTNKSIKQDEYRYNDLKSLKDIDVSKITVSDLKKVYKAMQERGTKIQTYLHVEAFFNRAIFYAVKIRLIKSYEPVRLNLPRNFEKVTEVYTDEMIGIYLSVIQQYPYRLAADVVELIYYTGMRRSEPLKLKWTDLNLQEGYVIIREAKSGRDEKKYLSDSSIEIIERQRAKSKTYIFESSKDEAVNPSYISYHSRRMADKAGLPSNFRPLHSLRHNVGTQLAMKGFPVVKIKEFLNHKNVETTMRYIDIAEGAMKDVANLLEADFSQKKTKQIIEMERIETDGK